jgi:hypothetical protein
MREVKRWSEPSFVMEGGDVGTRGNTVKDYKEL